ncbi:MAG: hypothetical protein IJ074_11620 [Clostridia bacterium]|nr:hypothetical protein [Clostridia bacterium]
MTKYEQFLCRGHDFGISPSYRGIQAMAAAKSRRKKYQYNSKRASHRFGRGFLAFCLAIVLSLATFCYVNAMTIRYRRAIVHINDLPLEFSGTTLLFISDPLLCGTNTADRFGSILRSMQSLHPDILLLGGNYVSPNPVNALTQNSIEGDADKRLDFARALNAYNAPLGKFAIAGENDGDPAILQEEMQHYGVQLLNNSGARLDKNGKSIYLVGLSSGSGSLNKVSSFVSHEQCVIAAVNDPSRITDINVSEAQNGGSWVDFCLCGHNLGGQIEIANRTLINLTEPQRRFLRGWFVDQMPILVSQGLGSKIANLRFQTQPEIWMITLVQ